MKIFKLTIQKMTNPLALKYLRSNSESCYRRFSNHVNQAVMFIKWKIECRPLRPKPLYYEEWLRSGGRGHYTFTRKTLSFDYTVFRKKVKAVFCAR